MSKKVSLKKKEKSIQKESNLLPLNEEPKEEIKQKSKKVREIQNEEGISSQPTSGVVYVGHLPWGFIDSTLKKYFSQFGTITRIISPKSSKTGRSVGYAFIEFEDEETARIAAKTMNNYILFEKILKCSFVEDKKKYDRILLKWKKKFEFKERYRIHCEKLAKKKSKEEIKEMIQGLLDREEKRREKMKELGIKYEYKGFKEIVDEYKKTHMNEINEKNKNRKNEKRENIKQKENQIKSKNNKKEKEEMELEENEEEENDDKFDEEEENEEDENEEEEEEIIKEKKINKNSKNEKKSNNKKIETIRKQKKLNELKKIVIKKV
jgi:RNA recognition motif-containing protein